MIALAIIVWLIGAYLLALPLGGRIFIAGYDGWVGYFYDKSKKRLYVCLIPCIVIVWQL